jgi:hypothetical protein
MQTTGLPGVLGIQFVTITLTKCEEIFLIYTGIMQGEI